MDRAQKEKVIAELREELVTAASIMLTDLTKVNVEKANQLRALFRKKGVQYRVAKNTLISKAVEGTPAAAMDKLLAGFTALAWHPEEPAVTASVLKDFLKTNADFKIKGGYLDGQIFEGEEALKVADLPSKDQLRAQFLGLVQAVPAQFLGTLEAAPRDMLGVLEAYRMKLEDEGKAE